jgi:hypothetical protein
VRRGPPPKALKRRKAIRHSKDLSVTISNLIKACDLISDPRHWGKGDFLTFDFTSLDYQICAQGALTSVGVNLPQYLIAARMVDPEYEVPLEHHYLHEAVLSFDSGHNSVISFNDDPETTHEDVMRLFNRAIHLAMADAVQTSPKTDTAPQTALVEA